MFPGRRMNLADRAAQTGFLGGNRIADRTLAAPNRPGAGLMGGPPPPMPNAENDPPNLREGEPGRECMSCKHYNMAARNCELYNFGTKPFEVCDSFSQQSTEAPADVEGPQDPDAMPPPARPRFVR